MGYDMQEGTLVRWLKEIGDEVQLGEPIAEIETDKAVIEFESTTAGIVKKIIVDAPWFVNGVSSITDEFLNSIDGALGTALEQLVPNAFTNEMTEVEVIKKES